MGPRLSSVPPVPAPTEAALDREIDRAYSDFSAWLVPFVRGTGDKIDLGKGHVLLDRLAAAVRVHSRKVRGLAP